MKSQDVKVIKENISVQFSIWQDYIVIRAKNITIHKACNVIDKNVQKYLLLQMPFICM